uniref:CUB domain-containing protein n=1 Tax=Panagrolaimus sp. JU765 TaxID=591449 RepID=A0AC34R7Q6_9BILA
LLWRSDDNIQRKGFNLTYSFVHFHADDDPGCGFSSHAKIGEIMSPNFPKDYPNSANCVWNLVVPFGYDIKLTITSMDIQNSHNCEKDSLQISQEHLSRALTPLYDYYFYFEHEEKLKTLCGNDDQPPIVTSSNRARINFTTDATVSGRGFKLKWEAICGTTLTLTHGVITSPHYPDFYPNDNVECNYLIFPIMPDNSRPIITLRVLDFNLESFSGGFRTIDTEANITQPC